MESLLTHIVNRGRDDSSLVVAAAYLCRRLPILIYAAVALYVPVSAHAQISSDPVDGFFEATGHDVYSEALLAISEGRFLDAERLLRTLMSTEPRHAGVWLDLAMLYCAAGNADAADSLFIEIERRFVPPPAILALMSRQRAAGCLDRTARREMTFRLARGRDSNVNQGASNANFSFDGTSGPINLVLLPDFLPRSDGFFSASADFFRENSPGGLAGVLQLQTRRYDRLTAFDYSSVFAGAELPFRLGDWGLKAAGSAGLVTLGHRVYLRQTQLQLETALPLPLPPGWQLAGAGLLSGLNYPGLSGFDSQGRELRATLTYRQDALSIQANAGAVQDLEKGRRPGGDRAGTQLGLQGRIVLAHGVAAEVSFQQQRWHGSRSYFPGLFDAARIQKTSFLRLATVLPLGPEQAVVLEFRDSRNSENFSIFDHRNRLFQMSWQWQPQQRP